MAGTNPYIRPAETRLPAQEYAVTFQPAGKKVDVDPADLPYDRTGLPGSILDVALQNDVHLDHACGGVVACSTCHVIVREGFETCGEPSDEELDMLDQAPGVEPNSRLGCQCVPDGTRDVVVEIPQWNRNLVSEAPH